MKSIPVLTEDHFCAEDFEKARVDGKKRLKHKAVPSIFSHRVPKKIRKPPFARLPNSPANNLAEEQAEPEEENLLIAADSIADGLKSSKEPHDHDESADVATEVPITSDIQEDAPPNMFSEVDVLKRQLNLERRKRARAEMECDALRSSFNGLLAEDQLRVLQKGTMRGSSWTQKTIQESLKVRLACGGRGYEYLRGNGWPLPAERTLQKHIEDIKFTPGILEEVFPALASKVATFHNEERYAVLMLDEIQLTPGLDYDITTRSVIGRPTLPSSDPSAEPVLATHALVFMLGGIASRWKQTVAYHFTAESFDAAKVLDLLFEIIRRCESIGLSVDCITSDMGGGNQAIWRLRGIMATKYGRPRTTCPHPCGNNRSLHFLADAPHLLKNLRGHLVRQQKILLDDDTVRKNKLPSNEVSIKYLEQLCEIDEKHSLKLAPRLKLKHLNPSHYEKMNVGTAYAVFNHAVASALRLLVEQGKIDEEALTTAWFVDQEFKWFSLMTSRTPTMALSDLCSEKGKEAAGPS
ncbi:hypothetical protein V5799_026701 [Amblyomma americanum]|uniref:Transposase n=1 Tax=Amblyomma americanum TaxID=6943 RepID=A0AAQ4DHT8_AMBAM